VRWLGRNPTPDLSFSSSKTESASLPSQQFHSWIRWLSYYPLNKKSSSPFQDQYQGLPPIQCQKSFKSFLTLPIEVAGTSASADTSHPLQGISFCWRNWSDVKTFLAIKWDFYVPQHRVFSCETYEIHKHTHIYLHLYTHSQAVVLREQKTWTGIADWKICCINQKITDSRDNMIKF